MCLLNFVMFSSNVFTEEFVLSSLRASPFTKPFFTPGGDTMCRTCIGMSPLVWSVSSYQELTPCRIFGPCILWCLRKSRLYMISFPANLLLGGEEPWERGCAMIPELNTYFLYNHSFHSNATKNVGNFLVRSAFKFDNQPGTFACKRTRCKSCPFIYNTVKILGPSRSVKVTDHFTCISTNVIYA